MVLYVYRNGKSLRTSTATFDCVSHKMVVSHLSKQKYNEELNSNSAKANYQIKMTALISFNDTDLSALPDSFKPRPTVSR